jgi:hypothetical protein
MTGVEGVVVAMTDGGYIAAGWLSALGLVGAYTAWVIVRGRRLSRRVPPEERRWS